VPEERLLFQNGQSESNFPGEVTYQFPMGPLIAKEPLFLSGQFHAKDGAIFSNVPFYILIIILSLLRQT